MSYLNRLLQAFVVVCLGSIPLFGQSPTPDYFRQSLTGAFIYGVKAGPNTYGSIPDDKPGFSIDYAFRLKRWLALEAGLDQIIRPVGSSVCCEYSTNAEDQLYLIPFGARYVWEPEAGRFRLTAGGGGAYLNHAVGNKAGGVLGSSGWSGQVIGSVDYAVTHSGWLRLGLTARYYFGSPKPSVNIAGPGFSTPNDTLHIVAIGPAITFSFH